MNLNCTSFKKLIEFKYSNSGSVVIWNYQERLLRRFIRDLEEKLEERINFRLDEVVEFHYAPYRNKLNLKEIAKELTRYGFHFQIF